MLDAYTLDFALPELPGTSDTAVAMLHDAERLRALDMTQLVDGPPSPVLMSLVEEAARALGAPVALMALIEGDRQFVAGSVGLPEPLASTRQLPLSHSFCRYVVVMRSALVVSDARIHPVLQSHAAVRDLGLVAYLGVPLITASGHALGSCCVVDGAPRNWTAADLDVLQAIAAAAMREVGRLSTGELDAAC